MKIDKETEVYIRKRIREEINEKLTKLGYLKKEIDSFFKKYTRL